MNLHIQPVTNDHIAEMPDQVHETLDACPRCGEPHPPLLFHRFHRPPPCGKILYWATCPTTNEPILAHLQ